MCNAINHRGPKLKFKLPPERRATLGAALPVSLAPGRHRRAACRYPSSGSSDVRLWKRPIRMSPLLPNRGPFNLCKGEPSC